LLSKEHSDEARALYAEYRAAKINAEEIGADLILKDFSRLCEMGHAPPLMVEIEEMLQTPSDNPHRLVR
jgi:hypothetical protein